MAHQHLVIAYVITWVIQLGYLGCVGAEVGGCAPRRRGRRRPTLTGQIAGRKLPRGIASTLRSSRTV